MDSEGDPSGRFSPSSGAMAGVERFLSRLGHSHAHEVAGGDWDGFAQALSLKPEALKRALETGVGPQAEGPGFIHSHMFASGACDRDGRLVVMDPAFARICAADPQGTRILLTPAREGRPRISFLVRACGDCLAVATATASGAHGWPLTDPVRDSLAAGRATFAVMANLSMRQDMGGADRASSLVAAELFRLTPHETRVLLALMQCGDIPQAAKRCGIGYETARDAVKAIMKKAGVNRQAALISLCMALQAGQLPPSRHVEDVLRDMFGLSPRQARTAVLAAQGQPRSAIAQVLAVSEHVVKSELKVIYAACRVSSAGGLSQMVADIAALTAISVANDLTPVSAVRAEPLRLIPRAGREGRIAVSDHGPISALPVIILHTATTSRHHPTAFIRALQAKGLRPIAIDRPGYGLSDMVDGDYLSESAHDLNDILNALGLEGTAVLARGGSMVLHRFAQMYPDRLIRAVVANPEPAPGGDRRLGGIGGQAKRLAYGYPALIEAFARHLSRRASAATVEGLIRRTLEASPADRTLMDDADFMRAYVHSTRHCALQGGAGFMAVARDEPRAKVSPLKDGAMMTILCGAEDPLYSADDSVPRWQGLWPGAQAIRIEGAGRLLVYQKPELVAALLRGDAPEMSIGV